MPIRDTLKKSETTPDERKVEDGVDVAELQKEAVAVPFKNNVFQHRSKTRIPFP